MLICVCLCVLSAHRAVYPAPVELHSHSSPCSLADDACFSRYRALIILPSSNKPVCICVFMHVCNECSPCLQKAACRTAQPSPALHQEPWATAPEHYLCVSAPFSLVSSSSSSSCHLSPVSAFSKLRSPNLLHSDSRPLRYTFSILQENVFLVYFVHFR